MNRDEVLWLVKSGGRVTGPFTRTQIQGLLESKEIGPLDEVSRPLRRWQTLLYHNEFRDIIEKLRQFHGSEKTHAEWTPTDHGGLTQTMTDLSPADLTDEITADLDGFTPTNKEIVIHNLKEQPTASAPKAVAGRFQPKGAGPSPVVQQKVENTTRWLWVAVIAVVMISGFLFMRQRSQVAVQDGRMSGDQLTKQVQANIQIGAYTEALRILKANFSDPNQAGELSFYYGALLIQVEGQTLLGRRMLQPIAASARPEAKQAITALGVADLIDGQYDSAGKHFEQAIQADRDYAPALVNRATLALARGRNREAREMASAVIQKGVPEGVAYLTFAESSDNTAGFLEASKVLNSYRSRMRDYDSEVALYNLYFEFMRTGKALSDDQLADFLDRDPELTENHRHNVFVYRGRASWQRLVKLCERMAQKSSGTAKFSAFMASCHYRAQQWDSAKAQIEKAVHQDPKDGLIQAWYSLILKNTGAADQASVVLGRANEYNRHFERVLPTLLQARFCQQLGDYDCARENWQKIYEKNLEDINAIAGLAQVQVVNKALVEARKLVDKGLSISGEFIPLLRLQQQAATEGW